MKAFITLLAASVLVSACAGPTARVQARPADSARAASAVAEQVRRCYRAPRVPSPGRNIVTRLFARYTADGGLVGLPLLVSQQGLTSENRPYASRMAEAAKLAILRCTPVRLPPQGGDKLGSDFLLTFSPNRSV